MTSIMSLDDISLYLKAFIYSLVKTDTVVSEKIQFEILYVHDLGPRSLNDYDLKYSHIFLYTIRCLLPLAFRYLAAIVSEKYTVFTFFPIEKAKLPNLPCRKIGQGHSRVIISTNYDGQESRMLHTKFCGNPPAGSGEEEF